MRGAAASFDRALADRTSALAAELGRLEVRCRAISRERQRDRRALWAVIAGVLGAYALLVVLLLRPAEPVVVHEQTPIVVPVPTVVTAPAPVETPKDAPKDAPKPPETGSAAAPDSKKHPMQVKTQGAPVKRN